MQGNKKQVAGVGMAVAAAVILLFLMSGKKASGAEPVKLPVPLPPNTRPPLPEPLADSAPLPEGPALADKIRRLENQLAYNDELLRDLFNRPQSNPAAITALQNEIKDLRSRLNECCKPSAVVVQ
jgi:hypothetical protein